jgi:hypothetical protein
MATKEERLAAIRKADMDRDSEFDDLGFEKGLGRIKSKERVGQYKRDREGARDMSNSKQNRGSQTETYKKSDDSTETFDRLESGADEKTRSKRKQRALDRETLRDARKERKATRIADRKGMSVSQAQDFMKNRRDRLNTAMGEFGKGIVGQEQDLNRIKDREYRKGGKGTRAEEYKPFADSNTRTKSTYYDNVIKPRDIDVKAVMPQSRAIDIKPYVAKEKQKAEQEDNITDSSKGIKDMVTPPANSENFTDKLMGGVVRDNVRTRDSGGFYNTEATGNQAMQNTKQRQNSNSLSELLSKVTINPNDILDDIRLKKLGKDRQTGAFKGRGR